MVSAASWKESLHLNHFLLALGKRNDSSTGHQFCLTVYFEEKRNRKRSKIKGKIMFFRIIQVFVGLGVCLGFFWFCLFS